MKVLIGVVAIAVIGVGVYVYMSQSDTSGDLLNTESEEVQEIEGSETKELSQVGTIEDIKAGGNVKCSYSSEYDSEGVMVWSSGVIYHANNQIKVEGRTGSDVGMAGMTEGFAIDMILDEDMLYSWSEQTGAFQIDLSKMDEFQQRMQAQYGEIYTADSTTPESLLEQSFEYECEDWSVDSTKFDLPTGVVFVDFFEMIETNMSQLENLMGQFGDIEIPIAQ